VLVGQAEDPHLSKSTLLEEGATALHKCRRTTREGHKRDPWDLIKHQTDTVYLLIYPWVDAELVIGQLKKRTNLSLPTMSILTREF